MKTKKIISIALLLVLLFGTLFINSINSALETSKEPTYEEGTNGNPDLKVRFETDGTIELKSHSSVNEIKRVGAGNQVVMFYDFNFNIGVVEGLGEPEFTDMKTGQIIQRDWRYVYFGNETYSIPTFTETFLENGTSIFIPTGTELRIRESWLPYSSKNIPSGKITLGIEVDVKVNDYIDGVWSIYGNKITKHSEWTADLNVGLVAYYKLNETSGTNALEVAHFNHNGTLQAGTLGNSGIIGTSYTFNGADSQYLNLSSVQTLPFLGAPFGISFWAYRTPDVTTDVMFALTNNNGIDMQITSGGLVYAENWQGASWSSNSGTTHVLNNTWMHFVMTSNGTNATIYLNNTIQFLTDTSNHQGRGFTWDTISTFAGGTGFAGRIDEFGLWNRSLSSAEVTQLYNGGLGITYTNEFGTFGSLNVTLIAPLNNTDYDYSDVVNFTSFVNSTNITNITISNVTTQVNFTNGTLFYGNTNTSGTIGNYHYNVSGFPNANNTFLWTTFAYGSNGIRYNASNGTLYTNVFELPQSPPTQYLTIPNFTMAHSDSLTISWTDYFTNISSNISGYVNISFIDYSPPLVQSLIPTFLSGNNNQTKYFLGEDFSIISELTSLVVFSYDTNRTIQINSTACNSAGCIIGNVFYINISESSELTSNFIITASNWFLGILPDAENLSFFQRIGIMFIVLLFITITGLIGMGAVNIEAPANVYIMGGLDILLLIYFVMINYIPIWLLVGLALLGVAITYFGGKNE